VRGSGVQVSTAPMTARARGVGRMRTHACDFNRSGPRELGMMRAGPADSTPRPRRTRTGHSECSTAHCLTPVFVRRCSRSDLLDTCQSARAHDHVAGSHRPPASAISATASAGQSQPLSCPGRGTVHGARSGIGDRGRSRGEVTQKRATMTERSPGFRVGRGRRRKPDPAAFSGRRASYRRRERIAG